MDKGVKHGYGMMLITHSRLVQRSKMSRSCTSLPLVACMAALFFFTLQQWYSLQIDNLPKMKLIKSLGTAVKHINIKCVCVKYIS
jgi:hypothetical protein